MPKEDPLDEGLNLIKKLLTLVEKNLYSEVDLSTLIHLNKKVMEIESLVTKIDQQISNELIETIGFEKKDIQMIEDGLIPEINQGEPRKIAEKTLQLRKKLEFLKDEVEKIRGPYKKEKNVKKNETVEKDTKYKRLRRREDWKQM